MSITIIEKGQIDMTAIRTDYGISGKSFGGMVTAKRTSVKGASSRNVKKVRQQSRQTTQESPMSGMEIGQISLEVGDMSWGEAGYTNAGTAVDVML